MVIVSNGQRARALVRGTPVALALVLAAACVALGAHAQEDRTEFTAAERRALIGGELVRRPVARTEGPYHYLGGTSYIRVAATPARVFEEALDTSAYTRLIPAVVEARLVEDHGDRRIVFLRHRLAIVEASYHAIVRIERDARTVRFDLDRSRPHDVRAGRGFLSVTAYRETESIVTWGVMADPGSAVLSGVFGGVISDWILKVPWCVRGRLEDEQPGC